MSRKKKKKPTLLDKSKEKNKEEVNMLIIEKEKIKKRKSQHVGGEVQREGDFWSSFHELLPLSFLTILGKKLFGGLGEKTLELHHLFSFLPTQPNILKKSFNFPFSLQNFLSTLFHL